jgi:hypothetical protein
MDEIKIKINKTITTKTITRENYPGWPGWDRIDMHKRNMGDDDHTHNDEMLVSLLKDDPTFQLELEKLKFYKKGKPFFRKFKNGERIFRGLKQGEHPEWPGWPIIERYEERLKDVSKEDYSIKLKVALVSDQRLTAMYDVICKVGL